MLLFTWTSQNDLYQSTGITARILLKLMFFMAISAGILQFLL